MQKHSLEIFAGPVIWQPKFFVGGTDTQCVIYVGLQIPPSPTAKFGRPPNATRKNFLPLPALLIFIAVRAGVASALAMFALAALQTYVLMLHIPAVARETIHFLAIDTVGVRGLSEQGLFLRAAMVPERSEGERAEKPKRSLPRRGKRASLRG